MTYLQVNYLKAYTDLRTGKMDFHQFMELINKVYEFGHQRGTLRGIEMCQKEIEDKL